MMNKLNTSLLKLKEDHEISTALYNSLVRNASKTYTHYKDVSVSTITLKEILSTYTLDEIKAFRQMGPSRMCELSSFIKKYSNKEDAPEYVNEAIISLEAISRQINAIKVTPDTDWADLYKQTAKIINEELVKYGIQPIDDYEG